MIRTSALAAVIGGILGCALAAWLAPQGLIAGWRFAALMVLGLSLGATLILALHLLTGGGWGLAIRPPLRAMQAALPVGLLMMMPLGLVLADFEPTGPRGGRRAADHRLALAAGRGPAPRSPDPDLRRRRDRADLLDLRGPAAAGWAGGRSGAGAGGAGAGDLDPGYRLADGAGAGLHLDDPSADRADRNDDGSNGRGGGLARRPPWRDRRGGRARRGSGQHPFRVRAALGLHALHAVADRLGRRPADRDRLVSDTGRGWLADPLVVGDGAGGVVLRGPCLAAVQAAPRPAAVAGAWRCSAPRSWTLPGACCRRCRDRAGQC